MGGGKEIQGSMTGWYAVQCLHGNPDHSSVLYVCVYVYDFHSLKFSMAIG